MIRINLLGRARPKATRTAVPIEATLQYALLAIALVVSLGALYGHYLLLDRENTKIATHIQQLTGEKARLEQLKQQVGSAHAVCGIDGRSFISGNPNASRLCR